MRENARAEGDWDGFTLAPKFGYLWFAETSGDFKTPARHSFNLQLDLDFGGEGTGFDIAPYFSYEDVESDDYFDYDPLMAVGLYFGFAYRFSIGSWYPYLGFGTRIGYMFGDWIDHGAEIYGRIPLGVTYYILEDLGILLELGLGYGITGLTGSTTDDFQIGHGFMLDVMTGIRWP